MPAIVIAVIVFLSTFGSVLLGAFLRQRLPEHHVSEDSKDIVVLSTGLVATLTALLLGLLVASANESFQSFNGGLEKMGTKLIALDRVLAHYGPETSEARAFLRHHTLTAVLRNWPEDAQQLAGFAPTGEPTATASVAHSASVESGRLEDLRKTSDVLARIQNILLELSPQDHAQTWRQAEALALTSQLSEEQWSLVEKAQSPLPNPLVLILVVWLVILFATFGLFAPRNKTVTTILVLCSLSASAAIFLVLELNSVTSGMMKASSSPLVTALQVMGPVK
ncbi:bestrophin-like domain [Candidatus Accumulibacter aalborgensis]|nr:hypothetical protein [Candidatus Accumulibacter aalborgensis]